MVADLQEPDDWLLLCTCVARMSELHPVYRSYPGYAQRDLESAIRAGRAILRGRRPGRADHPPDAIDGPIIARHRLDLIHNSLSERTPRPSGDIVQFRDLEIEWSKIKEYLRARAAECWPLYDDDVKPQTQLAHPRRLNKKGAKEFVESYVQKEQSAGRRPTQTGLEAAANTAGVRGARDYLREAFHKTQTAAGVHVGRGRPKKTPS